jgi:replicative DNA helicase
VRELNATLIQTNQDHYQPGLPNIYQENLFEAEGILLGAVFQAPELSHEITLEPFHFSQKRNQVLFQAFRELQKENRPIDVILLIEKLAGTKDMVSVSYMMEITSRCPSPDNYEHQSIVLNQYNLECIKMQHSDF